MLGQPRLDLRGLVGAVVVAHQVDIQVGRHGLVAQSRRAGRIGQRTRMTGDYEPGALEFAREHVEQIVRTGTTDGVTMKDRPLVLMTYRGAKIGKVRKNKAS